MLRAPDIALGRLLADLELLDRNGNEKEQARCLLLIARKAAAEGYFVVALRSCRLAERLAQSDGQTEGDTALRGQALGLLAEVLAASGHPLHATAAFDRAATTLAAAGRTRQAHAARLAAAILRGERAPETAREQLLILLRELSLEADPGLFTEVLLALGELDLDGRDFPAALVCAETAERAAALVRDESRPEDPRGELRLQTELRVRIAALRGATLAGLGRGAEADPLLSSAIHSLRDGRRPATLGRTLEWKGWLLAQAGELEAARDCWKEALLVRQKVRQPAPTALVALRLSASLGENPAEALRYLIVALEALRPMRRPPAELLSWAESLLRGQPDTPLLAELVRHLRDLQPSEPAGDSE